MKKLTLVLVAILFAVTGILAQTPNEFKYQAVLRDASGVIMASEAVTVDISILQGSASGTSVFDETHSVTTTAQGLINLNIGSVNTTGIEAIDFSLNTYFIEISVNSTVMGTSQLLSVPYALYAKTSGSSIAGPQGEQGIQGETGADGIDGAVGATGANGTNGIDGAVGATGANGTNGIDGAVGATGANGTNGIDGAVGATGANGTNGIDGAVGATGANGTNGIDGATGADGLTTSVNSVTQVSGNITLTTANIPSSTDKNYVTDAQQTVIGNTSNTNTGDQDGSETSVTAGTNVTVTGTGTSADPYIVNATSGSASHYVGDEYQGGIIFWLDATGEHGLICATADQDAGSGIQWYNGSYTDTEADGDGIGAGAMNTMLIIANQGSDRSTYAAGLCADYFVVADAVTYGGWYLPSKYELGLMYSNLHNQTPAVGGFSDEVYWSSTEYNPTIVWGYYFGNGVSDANGKDNTYRVRAVRAF